MDRRIIAQLFDSIDYLAALNKGSFSVEEISRTSNTASQSSPSPQSQKMVVDNSEPSQSAINTPNKFVILIVATNK